ANAVTGVAVCSVTTCSGGHGGHLPVAGINLFFQNYILPSISLRHGFNLPHTLDRTDRNNSLYLMNKWD
ncbi:hypothetical protein ACXWOO_10710, partial [Streptococcus pyogenes]